MNRPLTVAVTVAAATVLSGAPLTIAGAAVRGDHTSGSPGLYNPRDQLRAHTGVSCHYGSDGRLHSVSVITPKVKPLRIYTSSHRQSYVKWAAQLQQRAHGKWVAVGGWHKAPEKLLSAKAVWQVLKPLGTVAVSHAKVNAAYRVLERIQWKDYNSHTAVVGSVVHVMGAYYYGAHTPVATSCRDHRPTAKSFKTSVLAGTPLTLDLLNQAGDADHDSLRLLVLSATKNGNPTSVGAQPNGSITISTDQADAGKTLLVHWAAVDPAGAHSPAATLTVAIRGEAPGQPGNVSVTSVDVPAHPNSGNPTSVTVNLAWTAPMTGGTPDCYEIRAVFMYSSNDGTTFQPDGSVPQSAVCPVLNGTVYQFSGLTPDNDGPGPSYVLWQIRARNSTGVGPWTTTMSSPLANEIGQPGPDAFQVLRYSGYWIQSLPNATPANCTDNDTVKSQSPTSGTHSAGFEVTMVEYGEVAC